MLTFRRIFQGVIALAVMGLVADFYAFGGAGYGYEIHPYVYYAVALLALTVPVFWAFTYMCGGVMFGIAAGGFFDGVKMGFTLGLGVALGKAWPYVAAGAAGIYIGGGPMIYLVAAIALAVLLFGLDKALEYFWNSTTAGHE